MLKREPIETIVNLFIDGQLQLDEEKIQIMLQNEQFVYDNITSIFQEYLKGQIFFPYDYQDTIRIHQHLEQIFEADFESEAIEYATMLAQELKQILIETLQTDQLQTTLS